MRTIRAASAVALALVVSGCGDDGPPAPAVEITGIVWQSTEIAGAEIPDGAEPTLLLEAGTASGNAGCNTFTGGYTLDGDTLAFGALAMTRMACVGDVQATETAYVTALAAVATYDADDEILTLLDASGEPLVAYTAG